MKLLIFTLALLLGVVSAKKEIEAEGQLVDIIECNGDELTLECDWETKARRYLKKEKDKKKDLSFVFDDCTIKGFEGDNKNALKLEAKKMEKCSMKLKDNKKLTERKLIIHKTKLELTDKIKAIPELKVAVDKDVNDEDVYTLVDVGVKWLGCN